jgi:hypothetical protein
LMTMDQHIESAQEEEDTHRLAVSRPTQVRLVWPLTLSSQIKIAIYGSLIANWLVDSLRISHRRRLIDHSVFWLSCKYMVRNTLPEYLTSDTAHKAAISSLSLSFFATAMDSVFDPLANIVLNYCHRKALSVDLRRYPSVSRSQ